MIDGLANHFWAIEDGSEDVTGFTTYVCTYCWTSVTVMRQSQELPGNRRQPTDGELRSHGLATRCELATVGQVMET